MEKPEAVGAEVPSQGDEVVSRRSELAKPSSSSVALKEEGTENVVVEVMEEEDEEADEGAPLIRMGECRICQDEDYVKNLETPCACNGSLKYAHRKCVQQWCNEKGDITCEICHQTYQPDYTAPPRPESLETVIDIGGGWQIAGTPLNIHDPRLLAIAEAERQYLDAEYDDYSTTNANDASFCRSTALILMALLLMRHALGTTDDDGDEDDSSTIFSLFLLRIMGFLLPCYIMIWAISILQRRRQRQEAAALAATQFAFVVQSGQNGLPIAITSSAAPIAITTSSASPIAITSSAVPPPAAPSPPAAAPVTTPQQEHV